VTVIHKSLPSFVTFEDNQYMIVPEASTFTG